MKKRTFALAVLCAGCAQQTTKPNAVPTVDVAASAQLATQVRAEVQHAWRGYKQYAWGHDDLAPLSKGAHDWYAASLLMTPVDALDTLILLGLKDEANEARELIVTKLSFDRDIYVKHFEITIRLLGGLLSSYQLTHDERLLKLADDLGTRLLPAFDTPTGLPWVEVNLKTGATRGRDSNPAETGTLLLEYGTLARLTGKNVYYDKAKRALVETYKRQSKLGLVGSGLDVVTGAWTDPDANVGGGIDSYYEYLWKCWKLFGDKDCLSMWQASIAAINAHLADEQGGGLWYGHFDMNTGTRIHPEYGALDAFFAGLLAYSGDVERAKRLEESGFRMWQLHGIEPESLDYSKMQVTSPGYALRPEIIESAFYLDRLEKSPRWRSIGAVMFGDFVHYCRTDTGYAALASVITKQQKDRMESFVLAETFKYYWLLFAPRDAFDLDAVVFNTEAHPLRRVD
jgi:hypothetical protein